MKMEDRKKLYAALAAPFPEEAIERTDGRVTGRGYSTTGIKYQFVVNRLNETLGAGCFRAHRTVTVKAITTPKGRTAYEAICDLTLELGQYESGEWVCWGEALADGGHTSFSECDARKGAYTNAFKKAAAFFGVGKQAYEGTLDDDSVPADADENAPPATTNVTVIRASPPAPSVPQQPQSPAGPNRNRLSSRQHAAIFSLARKAGMELPALRAQVKAQFQKQLEYLSIQDASTLIEALNKRVNGNGHAGSDATAGAEAH